MSTTTSDATSTDFAPLRPCAKCPFLAKFKGKDDYLRPGRRRGIYEAVVRGGYFPCHETTVDGDEDEDGFSDREITSQSKFCAGLALVLLREGLDNQQIRIAERLHSFNGDALVERNEGLELWTVHELATDGLRGGDDDDDPEGDTCNTVNDGCLAPAGWLEGGAVIHGTEMADGECAMCGEACCSNCLDSKGLCGHCTEEDDDDEG